MLANKSTKETSEESWWWNRRKASKNTIKVQEKLNNTKDQITQIDRKKKLANRQLAAETAKANVAYNQDYDEAITPTKKLKTVKIRTRAKQNKNESDKTQESETEQDKVKSNKFSNRRKAESNGVPMNKDLKDDLPNNPKISVNATKKDKNNTDNVETR